MDGDGHVLWLVLDGRVDESSILSWEGIQILSSASSGLSHIQVAKVGQVGVVELDESAASLAESLDLGTIGSSQILKEVVEVRVGGDINGCSSTSEMSLCRK